MLTFHPLSLRDKPWIDRHVAEEASRSADFNFGNMFLWDGRYKQMVADCDHHLITICCAYEHPVFPFPIGSGDLAPAITEMREFAAANGFPLVIRGLEERHVALMEQRYPGQFVLTEDRDFADYIYDADKLISLAGKKLHGKRNHCNRFEAEHDWSFVPLTPELFPACLALLARWADSSESDAAGIEGEHAAILRALEHFDTLALLGGALFAEGELVGFSIGEQISPDTFDVHFEKARADINGAYPMVNREFVKLIRARCPEINYVNREDDMGLENLRRSKQSYYPDILLRKFTATWKET